MATTVSAVSHAVNNFYDRELLERAKPLLIHEIAGQMRDIPMNNTGTIKFRRYNALAVNTTELTEGVTPAGKDLSVTDVTAVLGWYGDYTVLTDKLKMETLDPLVVETLDVIGQQAGESLDQIVRDDLNAGTNVDYAGDATSTETVAALDIPTIDDLDAIILTLKNANAKKVTKFVSPDQGYATTPVRPGFIGIVHPNTGDILQGLTGFEHAETYARMGNLLPGELGRYKDIRFIETTHAKVFTGEGASSIDVYSMLVMGADAYGVTKLTGQALQTIVKDLGSAGSDDPLDQRSSVGWKATRVAKILNESWIVRYEHAIA